MCAGEENFGSIEVKGVIAGDFNGHVSKIKVYPLLTHCLKKWTDTDFSGMPTSGRALERKVTNLQGFLKELQSRAKELGGYRMEITFTGAWEEMKSRVLAWCTPQGLTGLVRVLAGLGFLDTTLTNLCRLGLTLHRKLVPLMDYFVYIGERFDKMPTSEEMRGYYNEGIPKAWQRRYSKLVNAFGWNSGFTSKFASRVRHVRRHNEDEGDGEEELEEEGEELAGSDAEAPDIGDDRDAEAGADPDQPGGAGVWDQAMPQLLRVWNQSKNPKLLCARGRDGGQSRAFYTREELWAWIWEKDGPSWRQRYRLTSF